MSENWSIDKHELEYMPNGQKYKDIVFYVGESYRVEHDGKIEYDGEGYPNSEELIDELLHLSVSGVVGTLVAVDQWCGAAKYILDGHGHVAEHNATGYIFPEAADCVYDSHDLPIEDEHFNFND